MTGSRVLLLLVAVFGAAEAQYPSSRRSTSTVGQLFADSAITPASPGRVRQLVCRGAAGMEVPVQQDPSPRNARQVAVSLSYRRSAKPAGDAYEQLEPGACTWNPTADPTIPAEPGIVHFDLDREGSAEIPDPRTLALWLGNPRHYWVFYVDDATSVAISHGAYGASFSMAGALRDQPTRSRAASLRRERLRCRGGTGLAFRREDRAGANLVRMTLTYKAAARAAGPTGGGLEPGTCAWADRTEAPEEPGRIGFTTAGNAQLKQVQSGSAVDRSPTAAERWPDAQTIPPYMADPGHYWTFAVSLANPDSALGHRAWLPSIPEDATPTPTGPVATTPSSPAGAGDSPYTSQSPSRASTSVSLPGGSTVADRYTPGAGTATVTDPRQVFDIRNVEVSAGLEGVAIRFEAAPNLAPTVRVATTAPVGSGDAYRFESQPLDLIVQGTPTGGNLWRYSAASPTPLARGTRYWFITDAPEGPNSRHNQTIGEFRTLRQSVKLGITHIDVVSDADPESPGDLWFKVVSCPDVLEGDIVGSYAQPVQWSEGRHQVGIEVVSRPNVSAPDRFRLFITGNDDDGWLLSGYGSSHPFWAWFFCHNAPGTLEPRATSKAEWNAAVIDLDLTQYAGPTATQTFVRRSQPLADGSKLSFEVRGYVTVTRE